MKIGVLGTGSVGRVVGGRLVELGHDVVIGTRDVEATAARLKEKGEPAYPGSLVTHAEAAAHGELVVNATSGHGSLPAVSAGGDALAGKVVLDISNPLDFSGGFPPGLFVKDSDSLAEQIQRAVPAARVVKALNTVTAEVMARPQNLAGGDHTVFVCGDDADAKTAVTGLLRELGWTDVVDVGDLSTARGVEMYVTLWVRLYGALGTDRFNIKLVR